MIRLPLREQRARERLQVPGVQEPWVVAQGGGAPRAAAIVPGPPHVALLRPNSALDPFDSLPIATPFRSKELFQYCESQAPSRVNPHSVPLHR